jgi:hypothetical protein
MQLFPFKKKICSHLLWILFIQQNDCFLYPVNNIYDKPDCSVCQLVSIRMYD